MLKIVLNIKQNVINKLRVIRLSINQSINLYLPMQRKQRKSVAGCQNRQ